jgi:RNA polymerase sigma-70 factor (ECF subfamily)
MAALTRRFGSRHLELIEDAVQTALLRGLERWPVTLPDHVDSWLLRVANNQLIDSLRRASRLEQLPPERDGDADIGFAGVDDELALIFMCCHPSLPRAAQLALTLKIVCGLTPAQIAVSFLTSEATVAQRLVRARQRLRGLKETFEIPDPDHLSERLDSILEVLYLMFNEGYSPAEGETGVRQDLCREALRLCRLITNSARTNTPTAGALHALLCFQTARIQSRFTDEGNLLLLFEQDRSRWDVELINEGFSALHRAGRGDALSRFHLEAGIAACHAAAPDYQSTDWPRILFLYDALREWFPSVVVDVNRAVAVAMVRGAAAGLEELDSIHEREIVLRYPFALAAYAELHTSLGQLDDARDYLARALAHQPSSAQRDLLQRKQAAINTQRQGGAQRNSGRIRV